MTAPAYYRVSPKFWADTEEWSDDARLLALYLLTCPHRTTEGLFRLTTRYMAFDLGWAEERLAEPLAQLLAEGFIERDEERSLVLIVNAMKYQAPQNPNQVKHALRKLEEIPRSSPLTSTFKRLAQQFCERLAERLPEGFGESPAPSQAPTQTQTPAAARAERPAAEVLSEAVDVLLLRDGSTERAASKGNPGGWLAAAKAGRVRDHQAAAERALADDPSLTAEALADLLEPLGAPGSPSRPQPVEYEPEPYEPDVEVGKATLSDLRSRLRGDAA